VASPCLLLPAMAAAARLRRLRAHLLPGGGGGGPRASCGTSGEAAFPAPDAEGSWPEPEGAAQTRALAGMDLTKLEQAFEYVQRSTPHGGLAVVRRGQLCFERYFGRAHRDSNPVRPPLRPPPPPPPRHCQ